MWKDNKIEKKFFRAHGATTRLRLAMDLGRADLVTELLRLDVQAPSLLNGDRNQLIAK
jgi:hypothetical protein